MDSQDSTVSALILKNGDSEIGKITPLNVSPFLIGRGAESSLKLRQKSISRKQCSFERNGTNWVLRSLGSRPVTLNGNLLFEDNIKTLKCSDIIELPGAITFEFRCSPDQNGRCCEDSEADICIIPYNDSEDFAIPKLPRSSTPPSSLNSSSVDKQPADESACVVEVQSFNTDDLVNIDVMSELVPVNSSSHISPNLRLPLDTDQLTKVILMFANHLEGSESFEMIDNNCSRLSDNLIARLEFTESMEKYGIDESCEAHERNGNIGNLLDAVQKLSTVLDKRCISDPEPEEVIRTRFDENLKRLFLPIDVELIKKAKELVNVFNNLPDSSKTSAASSEKKVPRICCCKHRNGRVSNKKRKEPVSGDANDHSDDENDVRKKVKSQEAKIEFLQMKLKEKENISIQLESVKQQNDGLLNKVAELKRTLADRDVMELEFKVLQESVKYREEDKRSKDILQEKIDSLQSDNTNLKIEREQLVSDLEKVKNENAEMMDKYKKLEEKLNERTNLQMALGSLKDGTDDNQCCEVGAARTFSLLELFESELNCSICGEMFIEPTVTNCNHTFCSHCLREWKKMKRECPFCRTIVVQECKISFLDELIVKALKYLSPKLGAERFNLIQERIAPPIQPPPAKRPRVRGRRVARNVRGQQNPVNPIPYHVDPISGFPDNFLEDMALRMILMGPGLPD